MALVLKQLGYLLLKMGGTVLLRGDSGAVSHVLAPAWRTADAGNGQTTGITFASPLDPTEIKFYTINWAVEMDGTADTISLSSFSLSAAAISAGLLIHAVTNDSRTLTVWLKLDPAVQTGSQWSGAGETHTMSSRITTTGGQIHERTIRIVVRQI